MLPEWLKIELLEKWERLAKQLRLPAARQWISEHPSVVFTVIAALALLLLIITLPKLFPDKPPPKPVAVEKAWYYDLNTGKLFIAEAGRKPPIDAPSGPSPDGKPAGVRAYVLSYKPDPNESERFIAYLETTGSPDMLPKLPGKPGGGITAQKWTKGNMIRRVNDTFWVPADSPLGLRILREAYAPNKKGQLPTYCRPR